MKNLTLVSSLLFVIITASCAPTPPKTSGILKIAPGQGQEFILTEVNSPEVVITLKKGMSISVTDMVGVAWEQNQNVVTLTLSDSEGGGKATVMFESCPTEICEVPWRIIK